MRHERRRKIFNYQSCNRRKTGVCGDDKAALEMARQKSLVPNNARRFFETRERDGRKAAGSFAADPFDFASIIFIRSWRPGSIGALPVPGSVCLIPASALSGTKPATVAAARGRGSVP
jgi:hypothetical protein